MCYMFHSAQPHWDMWQAIQNIKLPNMLFSPVSCPSSLLATDIFLTTQFFNNVNLCSSLKVTDQVSYPCQTTSKITVLYILIFLNTDSKL
jgi:hypothetical protein